MHIKSELEAEKLKQQQWQTAMDQIQEIRQHNEQEHNRILEELKGKTEATKQNTSSQVLSWFKSQVSSLNPTPTVNPEEERANQQRIKEIEDIKAQQAQLRRKLAQLEGREQNRTLCPQGKSPQPILKKHCCSSLE